MRSSRPSMVFIDRARLKSEYDLSLSRALDNNQYNSAKYFEVLFGPTSEKTESVQELD